MVRLQPWSFGGMWSTPTLLLLPGALWPRVVTPDWVLSIGQRELFDYSNCEQKQKITCKSELLEIELFDHLTEGKQMTDV